MVRDYLNREETNQFMITMAIVQVINGERSVENKKIEPMHEDWLKRGMMTKEESKWLKTAQTYLNKFIVSKLKSLGKDESKKILKKIEKFDFRLVDDYTFQKILRNIDDKFKQAVLDREHFNKFCEEIMFINCKDCTKDRCQCELYEIFDENLVPNGGYEMPNCPYSYSIKNKKE